MENLKNRKKIHCNTCSWKTWHELKCEHNGEYVEEHDEPNQAPHIEREIQKMWACRGCDTALLEVTYKIGIDAEDPDYQEINIYPKRHEKIREKKNFYYIKPYLKKTYEETLVAYNSGLTIICAMGLRALLEGICVEQGINDKKAWGLEKKLKLLENEEHVDKDIIKGLAGLKFMGDDAAHRLKSSQKIDLLVGINVMEDLLNSLYEVKSSLKKSSETLAEVTNIRKEQAVK